MYGIQLEVNPFDHRRKLSMFDPKFSHYKKNSISNASTFAAEKYSGVAMRKSSAQVYNRKRVISAYDDSAFRN